jgi:flavin-dependent dehydrogenase
MPSLDHPVVIAGAGPAGSTLAIRLRRLGLPVILIERYKFPREKLCGEFISPECLSHFDELAVLDEMLESGGDRIYETVFYETGGRSINVPSRWFAGKDFALSLSRARMDEVLLNAAKASGANVMDETVVTGLVRDHESIVGVKVRDKNGQISQIGSSLTVDATGRSRVLSRLAEKQLDRREPKPKFVGFKAHMTGVKMPLGVCEIYGFRDGYAGLSFVEGGNANLCLLAKASLLAKAGSADAIVSEFTKQNSRARETLSDAVNIHDWLAVAVSRFGAGDVVTESGLFAVGDSAAFIDPFTGSGMLMAIESSGLLAHCISENGIDHRLLKNFYCKEHRKRFRTRLRVSGMIRSVAYEPFLSSAAIGLLSVNSRLRELLARRTRPASHERSL